MSLGLDHFLGDKKEHKNTNQEIKPIDYPIEPKTRSPMYDMTMNVYWSRKPFTVTSQYVKHYSKGEDPIVMDPFSGIGVVPIEALKMGVKSIAMDLNPWATFITKILAMPIDLKDFKKAFGTIESDVKKRVQALYETKCGSCGERALILRTVYDGDKPRKIRYECAQCGKKYARKPTADDIEKIRRIEASPMPRIFPRTELVHNGRINVYKGMKVQDLFTKRNALALSMIFERIDSMTDSPIKDLLKYTFCYCLRPVSKLIHEGGGQTMGYWIPPKGMIEKNVWLQFEEAFRLMYEGKQESQSTTAHHYREAKDFEDLRKNGGMLVLTSSATNMKAHIPDNSIDYILTDPPYADDVPYFELSLLFASWLGFPMNLKDEIVISDSPVREKGPEEYREMMTQAFSEVFRILKPGHYLSVWFHNRDLKVWNMLINILDQLGFEKVSMMYQPHSTVTFKQVVSKAGTMRGHFILNYRKTSNPQTRLVVRGVNVEDLIVKTAKRVIVEYDGASLSDIYKVLIPELAFNHGVLQDVLKIQDDLKPVIEKYFDERDGKWYIREADYGTLDSYIPLKSRLRLFIPSILKKHGSATIDEIYSDLMPLLTNGKTPDKREIAPVLNELCEELPDGKWRLRPVTKQVPLAIAIESKTLPPLKGISAQEQHDAMIFALAKIGERAGCSTHVGKTEQRKNASLAELSISALPPLGLPDEKPLRIIQEIDALWLSGNAIVAAFEVEDSTPVYSGLGRFSDLKRALPNIDIKAYIVIPEKKREKVIREFSRAVFMDQAKRNRWGYILYSDLLSIYEDIRAKPSLRLKFETVDHVARNPFE
jgi:DNA modification methylase